MSRKAGLAAATNSTEEKTQIASSLAKKRWKLAEQDDATLREHFRDTPLADAFEELSKMRKQCEIAAGILEDRHSHATMGQFCYTCKTECPHPYSVEPTRDKVTQIVSNRFFCSRKCAVALSALDNKPEAVVAQRA